MVNTRSVDDILSSVYYDPKSPGCFASRKKLYAEAKQIIPDLTEKYTQVWLNKQLTYSLHKQARRNFLRNRVIVSDIDEQWQADLVDMQEFKKANGGNSYILTVIDIFSKYAWAVPIKKKSGIDVTDAFQKIFNDYKRYPNKLQTDQGKEFLNKDLKELCKKYNINQFATKNQKIKCSVVERFNRTLKEKMFKYFTSKGTRRYISVLQNFVHSYNHSVHSAIGKRPAWVNESDKKEIMYKLYGVLTRRELLKKSIAVKKNKANVLKRGDKVRTAYELKPAFDKGYYPNWSDAVYEVKKSIQKLPRTVYTIKGKNSLLYPEEVQKIDDSGYYRIEKIINKRRKGNSWEYRVKWVGYPNNYNTWIPESKIKNLK